MNQNEKTDSNTKKTRTPNDSQAAVGCILFQPRSRHGDMCGPCVFNVWGSGFKVQGLDFRVWGLGFLDILRKNTIPKTGTIISQNKIRAHGSRSEVPQRFRVKELGY